MVGTQAHVNPYPRVPRKTFEAVVWSGFTICTLALAFRCFVRIHVFRRLQADDFLTIFAWILLLATALIWRFVLDGLYELSLVSAGAKLPSPDFVPLSERYLKGTLAVIVMFYLGLWLIKINFLMLFYRLGESITRYRVMWWVVTVFTVCVGLSTFGTIHYVCLASPLGYISEHCRGSSAIRFQSVTLKLNCAWDVMTDAFIVMIPITILHNVRISLARKLALGGLFSLVVITMIVAIIRVTVVGDNSKGTQIEMTWLYLWCFIESSVALLVACLASFRTLFSHKEKLSEVKEAEERERVEKIGSGGLRSNALRARLKHFQASLFETTHGERTINNGTRDDLEVALVTVPGEGGGHAASLNESMDTTPKLNTHNLDG